jgi:anti-anti-sigma factor
MNDEEIVFCEERSGFLWFRFLREITMDTYHPAEEKIMAQLTGSADRLVLDFSNVRYLYSSGIGFIVRLQKIVSGQGGVVCLVNVSQKIRQIFESNNLDKVIPIYATDVEWEIFREEIWRERVSRKTLEFVYILQVESPVCFITLAGCMDVLHDLSRLSAFEPDPAARFFVINLDTLDVMDTYGSQVFLEMVERIRAKGGICISCGAKGMMRELLSLLSIDMLLEHCDTEIEAFTLIEQYRKDGI